MAAISSATHWCVRTDGVDTNGGGFVAGASGVDYSNQAAAQNSGTLGTATGTTSFTDAGYSFVANDVGSIIQINSGSGFTLGFYQIVSVAGGAATLNVSPGTGTVAQWSQGGALLTIGKAFTSAAVAQNTINIKAGTYTLTSTITIPALDYIQLIGYNSTFGDGGTRPLITTATNSTILFTSSGLFHGLWFWNINFSNTAGTPADGFIASSGGPRGSIGFVSCDFTGFVAAVRGDFNGDYYFSKLTCILCKFTSCTGTGAIWHDGGTYLDNCLFSGNTHAGFYVDSNQTTAAVHFVNECVFYNNVNGIYINTTSTLCGITIRNTAFDANTGDGLKFGGAILINAEISNSVFVSNGGWGSNWSSTTGAGIFNNCWFYNNMSGTVTNFSGITINPSTSMTVYPFTSAGTNYAINSTAGGGAVLKAGGFNGVTPFGTGYESGGPLQPNPSGGGGGSLLVNPGMSGGIRG